METKTQSNDLHPSSLQEREVLTALKEYVQHKSYCPALPANSLRYTANRRLIHDCTCGLDAPIAKAESAPSVEDAELCPECGRPDAECQQTPCYHVPPNTTAPSVGQQESEKAPLKADTTTLASSVAAAPAWRADDWEIVRMALVDYATSDLEPKWAKLSKHMQQARKLADEIPPLPRSPRAGEDQQP